MGDAIKHGFLVPDDGLLKLGDDGDGVLLNRSTILAADTILGSVLVGTVESQAIAANSTMIANATSNGDIALYTNKGGNSQMGLWLDGSAGDAALMAASGASVDHYIAGAKVLDHSAGVFAFQEATNITTTSGAITMTPLAGQNLNIVLSTTGDLVVNTSQFVVDTSEARVGLGTATPAQKLHMVNGHTRMDQVAAPGAATVAVNVAAGNLNGAYYYRITYVTALGETETGTVSALVSPVNQQVDLSAIPTSADSAVTSRKIYRTTAGGSDIRMQLVATIADNSTTTYTDNIADGSLGAFESRVNTTGGVFWIGTIRRGFADSATTAWGINALRVTTGYYNSAFGLNAMYTNTTGYSNSAFGYDAHYSNTTGYQNTAMGMSALAPNTTGYSNSALGVSAGRYITGGSVANETSNTSVYIGVDVRAKASGDANEVVIGYGTTGLGSNSANLGNDSITLTGLHGVVSLGIGEAGTTVATGNTLRAPNIATGGAGNIAGADLTIAAGLGTGIGDVGTIIFSLPIVAATGDNIQTIAARLTLDMAAGNNLYVQSEGTGANGMILKNLKNAAASALSGTQLDVEIDIGGTPYYFTVYPTKA